MTSNLKQLRQVSKRYFSSNPTAYIFSGVFFCLFGLLGICFCFLDPLLGSVIEIFVMLPLLLGGIMTASSSEFYQKVSITNLFRFSTRYYSPQFYGCFGALICLLKGIIVEVASTFIVLPIMFFVFRANYGANFTEPLKLLLEYITSFENDSEALVGIFAMNNNMLDNFTMFVSSICSLFGILTFIVAISYRAITAYFRLLLRNDNAFFGRRAVDQTIKNNRRAMFKDHLLLNWPLLLLALIGLVGGFLFSYYVVNDLLYAIEFASMFAFLAMAFYFPIYLANMASIFEKYQFTIAKGISDSIKETIRNIQSSVDLSEEDKKQIEETLKKLEEDDNELEDEENNKKDSQ